ncbi:MAG: hypothetical protein ACKO0X_10395, partial [Bacteroidota bacterium]
MSAKKRNYPLLCNDSPQASKQITAKGLHSIKASTIHLAELTGNFDTDNIANPVRASATNAP